MSNINDEMNETALYAVKASKERYELELDFSDKSIEKLELVLEKIYWGFYSQFQEKSGMGLIYQTAIIWGSYLGEYMRRKWGGTWIAKDNDRYLSILDLEFYPIKLVYERITVHPEHSIEKYLIESELTINNKKSLTTTEPSEYFFEPVHPPKQEIIKPIPQSNKKKYPRFLRLAIFGLILLVIANLIAGYLVLRTEGMPSFSFFASANRTNTSVPIVEDTITSTPSVENTHTPTMTLLPTSTPSQTITPSPSTTPLQTYTQTSTPTATSTITPKTPTRTPTSSATAIPRDRTNTPVPTTLRPTSTFTSTPWPTGSQSPQPSSTPISPPTSTQTLPPTFTQPPPVVIESCDIDPSIVPVGISVTITFIVNFSAPGYGFDSSIDANYNGVQDCSGVDSDGDGVAYCDGSSGELPASTTVYVTLSSSVGDCVVSYSSR